MSRNWWLRSAQGPGWPVAARGTRGVLTLLLVLAPAGAVPARAWGPSGHRIVAEMALRSLPPSFPSFVRQNESVISFVAFEPDRWRDRGQPALRGASTSDHYIEFEEFSSLTERAGLR